MKFKMNVLLFYCVFLAFFVPLLCHAQDAVNHVIHPVEAYYGGEAQRQRVDLTIKGELKTLMISVNPVDNELIIPNDSILNSLLNEWQSPEEPIERIRKFSSYSLGIFFKDKIVFDSRKTHYDYIQFSKVCYNLENRPQLLFSMSVEGTANADIHDILFIYYEPEDKQFHHKIVASKYVKAGCDISQANKNKQAVNTLRTDGLMILKQLSPSEDATQIAIEKNSHYSLPIKTITQAKLDELFEQFKQLKSKSDDVFSENTDPNIIYDADLTPRYAITTPIENKQWRIVELSYTEIWHSWGVLLALNKQTGQWTSFYSIPNGGSKIFLYQPDLFKLEKNILTGTFCPYCSAGSYWGSWKDFEINLDEFTARPIKIEKQSL